MSKTPVVNAIVAYNNSAAATGHGSACDRTGAGQMTNIYPLRPKDVPRKYFCTEIWSDTLRGEFQTEDPNIDV